MDHLKESGNSSLELLEDIAKGLHVLGQDVTMSKKVATAITALKDAARLSDKINAQNQKPTRNKKELDKILKKAREKMKNTVMTKIFGPVVIDPEKNEGYVEQHSNFFRELDKIRKVVILTHWSAVSDFALLKAGNLVIPVTNFLEAIGQTPNIDSGFQNGDYEDQLIGTLNSNQICFEWEVRESQEGCVYPFKNKEEFIENCGVIFDYSLDPQKFGKWVWGDKEFVEMAVEIDPTNFFKAQEHIKNNPSLAIWVISDYPKIIFEDGFPGFWKKDPSVIFNAIYFLKGNKEALKRIKREVFYPEIFKSVKELAKQAGQDIDYFLLD